MRVPSLAPLDKQWKLAARVGRRVTMGVPGRLLRAEGSCAALTKEEKTKIKEAKEEMEAPYGTVILDTHTEKNGNFRVEPAGLFRGRGEHPKMGNVKGVIAPEVCRRRRRMMRAAFPSFIPTLTLLGVSSSPSALALFFLTFPLSSYPDDAQRLNLLFPVTTGHQHELLGGRQAAQVPAAWACVAVDCAQR